MNKEEARVLDANLRLNKIARATYQAEKGGVMTPEQAAYGALWRMMTANPFLRSARACLLTAIGGRGSDGHHEAVAWAVATFPAVTETEILRRAYHEANQTLETNTNLGDIHD